MNRSRLTLLMRAPGTSVVAVAHLYLLLFVAAMLVSLRMPEHGLTPTDAGGAVALGTRDGDAIIVPNGAQLLFVSDAGRLAARAETLAPDFLPSGGREELRRFYADRDRLGIIAAAPGARAVLPTEGSGERIVTLRPAGRGVGDLPLDFWLLAAQAVAIGTLGGWIRLTAPRQLGAWMFGASCDGILLAGLSGAVFDARSLTADGGLLWSMHLLNMVGTNLSAAGLMALFLYMPRRIAPSWLGPAALAAAALTGVAEGYGLIPLGWFYALLVLPNVAFLAAAITQWRVADGNPAARAVMRSVGAGSFAGAALLCGGMVVPVLLGIPSFASDGMTILPVALVYGTIAFGIAGTRLFVLDAWSYRLALGAAAVLLLLATDALLLRVLDVERPVALALALLAIGYGYLPLRAFVWRWVMGAHPLARDQFVRQAVRVTFAIDPEARRGAWRDLLDRVFSPLEVVAGDGSPEVLIDRSGEVLNIPATADSGALCLRFARRGTRLFSPEDAAVARELVTLLQEAAVARDAYTSGVREERGRIARDLHDDVSGLLLTGLHRAGPGDMREDVRQALAEIRTIVSSLADGERPLADVLADIRHEAATRLTRAGVALAWPVLPGSGSDSTLDYARSRALTSSLREIVTNIVKHAGASQVEVAVAHRSASLLIAVQDDGGGAPASTTREAGTGRGLVNLVQRFEEIGGRCTLEPQPTGFRVSLVLPLDRPRSRSSGPAPDAQARA